MARKKTTARKRKRARISHRERILNELEREIRQNYKVGARLPAESKLAERFGVSNITVREALAHLAEKGMIRREQGRGNFVEDPTAAQHIGIINDLDLSSLLCMGYWLPLTQHLHRYFEGQGYRVRLYMGHIEPGQSFAGRQVSGEFIEDVEKQRLMGLVVLAGTTLDGFEKKLAKQKVPTIGHAKDDTGVLIDYRDMLGRGLEYLSGQGCRRIGLLNWGLSPGAVKEVFAAQGVPFHEDLLYHCRQLHHTGAGFQEFLDLWDGAKAKPDGLFVCDEILFGGASMAILQRRLSVPDELRLCTHFNEGSRTFSPLPRGEVLVSSRQAAEMVGSLLLRQIRGETVTPGIRYLPLSVVDRAGL